MKEKKENPFKWLTNLKTKVGEPKQSRRLFIHNVYIQSPAFPFLYFKFNLQPYLCYHFLMTPSRNTPLPTSKMSERALREKLRKTLIGIIIVVIFAVLSLFFFAPQVGSLFGFLSKNRNDPGYTPLPKPTPPVFVNAPESVKDEIITLHGKALPGNTVKLFVNGPEKAKTTVGSDEMFTFSDIKLNLGTNTIFAKAMDDKGNESENSQFLIIKYDKDSPKIEITNLDDGDVVKNLNKRIEVVGKVNEKAVITINEKSVIQKSDLTFDFFLSVDKEGDVKIKVEAVDIAGNKSEEELEVKYVKG